MIKTRTGSYLNAIASFEVRFRGEIGKQSVA